MPPAPGQPTSRRIERASIASAHRAAVDGDPIIAVHQLRIAEQEAELRCIRAEQAALEAAGRRRIDDIAGKPARAHHPAILDRFERRERAAAGRASAEVQGGLNRSRPEIHGQGGRSVDVDRTARQIAIAERHTGILTGSRAWNLRIRRRNAEYRELPLRHALRTADADIRIARVGQRDPGIVGGRIEDLRGEGVIGSELTRRPGTGIAAEGRVGLRGTACPGPNRYAMAAALVGNWP
jgi:hypothetical protein